MTTLQNPPTKATTRPHVDGLTRAPCYRCTHPIIWCRTSDGSKRGTHPIAVEDCPEGLGDVGISTDLFGAAPSASELHSGTSRYRKHGPHCSGPASFSGASFKRGKTR